MMSKATPRQLRLARECADRMVKAGVLFICMPVINEKEGRALAKQADEILERMAIEIEG